jgi:hypothetical protein
MVHEVHRDKLRQILEAQVDATAYLNAMLDQEMCPA